MTAQQLPISTIVNISVSSTPQSVSAYNTSNLALFTGETPTGSFGALGYKMYQSPGQVATDFGTSSTTYLMALAVFSQQPNILSAGGYLVVIPFVTSETLDAAIARTSTLVSYFGVISAQIETQVHMLAAAAVLQAANMIGFFVADTAADVATGGKLDLLRSGAFTQSRGLLYIDASGTPAGINAMLFMAAYASRALSTNFYGSNTTQTMNLKSLATIQPDPNLTATNLSAAMTAGADCYPSLQGVSALVTSGANGWYDDVYNLQWFIGALQVAGFNFLAQAATKIPQTEAGMSGLKGAYRSVCEQAVTNRYAAPGSWTSPTTFGNLADLVANVANRGYYIFSTPVAQQLQAQRVARTAPLVQIALKAAGAIHSSAVIVNVNP